jgi:hypothetical protein
VRDGRGGDADRSARIERTPYASPTALQHVRVDHGRTDVLVPQEFLHGPNIVPILQEVCCEAMSERFDILLHLIDTP